MWNSEKSGFRLLYIQRISCNKKVWGLEVNNWNKKLFHDTLIVKIEQKLFPQKETNTHTAQFFLGTPCISMHLHNICPCYKLGSINKCKICFRVRFLFYFLKLIILKSRSEIIKQEWLLVGLNSRTHCCCCCCPGCCCLCSCWNIHNCITKIKPSKESESKIVQIWTFCCLLCWWRNLSGKRSWRSFCD